MRLVSSIIALWLAFALPMQAAAQDAPPPDEVKTLLKVLEDDAARAKLIARIKETQTIPAVQPVSPLTEKLPGFFKRIGVKLKKMSPEDIAQSIGLSLAALLLAWAAAGLLQSGLERGVAQLKRHEERMPGLAMRAGRYRPFLKGVIRLLAVMAAVVGVLQAFDLDALAWFEGTKGRWLAWRVVTVLLVAMVALILWELAAAALEGALRRLDGQGGRRHGRLKTLAPLLRTLVAIVLIAMSVLIMLSELGVNIAPLLAGAGMVGLAFGLGAQKLVQDLLGSISMLLEDTLAVGDVVRIGEHAGVIEKMTLVDIQLRDQAGYLHVIPFSKIESFVNMTVDFSYAMFEVGVSYRVNVDEVMKVLADLGGQMAEDEQFGQLIQEPLEVLGLDKFTDSAVILKARMKTEPGKQWVVMREFNRRMKAKFDELGIEIPFPQIMVWMGEGKKG
ncbi:MAG: mechanosensitive ion channel family protein [Alphaproteobacteria bacterium]|nr:mechanosensitive ion channel family protein [Alphaproteobacteria bacterium]